mmetsp:Transcript_20092/g.32548  ORF Transcript_20092/g.32548 Transcript_20092/m.32548 type:complete len:261 (+) Transcript_20092:395-1177(+)
MVAAWPSLWGRRSKRSLTTRSSYRSAVSCPTWTISRGACSAQRGVEAIAYLSRPWRPRANSPVAGATKQSWCATCTRPSVPSRCLSSAGDSPSRASTPGRCEFLPRGIPQAPTRCCTAETPTALLWSPTSTRPLRSSRATVRSSRFPPGASSTAIAALHRSGTPRTKQRRLRRQQRRQAPQRMHCGGFVLGGSRQKLGKLAGPLRKQKRPHPPAQPRTAQVRNGHGRIAGTLAFRGALKAVRVRSHLGPHNVYRVLQRLP